jgi:hypothetical protein
MTNYGQIMEKVIRCGKYGSKARFIEVDIGPDTRDTRKRNSRQRKKNVSEPKQKILNDKNAIRYLFQLIKANFTEADNKMDLSYKGKFKPKNEDEADNNIRNYIDRVNRARKKLGLPKARYICITEYGRKGGRIHHHLLISGGLDRDLMEALWCDRKRKGVKERERLGYANCDRLQFEKDGIVGLSVYISKDLRKGEMTEGQMTLEDLIPDAKVKGKRRWMQSKGLIKPWYTIPEHPRYTNRRVEKIVNMPPDCEAVREFFEKKYKGYELDTCEYIFNDFTSRWSIYLTMHLKDDS